MSIIATEDSYVKPLVIGALYSINGEHFNFVLTADKELRFALKLSFHVEVKSKVLQCCAMAKITEWLQTHASLFERKRPRLSDELFSEHFPFNSPMPNVTDIPQKRLKAYDTDRFIVDNPPDFRFFLFIGSPTLYDETISKFGNYYRLSCKFSFSIS